MVETTGNQNQVKELEDIESFKEHVMNINDYEHKLGLKIKEKNIDATTIMFLKKETNLSISEIKKRVSAGDYLLEYGLGDDKGLHHINTIKKDLANIGLTVRLFEDDKERKSNFFDNLEEMHKQIALETGLTDEDFKFLY